MELGLAAGSLAFQHLFDEVDAPPGAIQFVAKELIGGAGGGAEATMDAGAQDGIGLPALVTVANEIGQLGLHGYSSG